MGGQDDDEKDEACLMLTGWQKVRILGLPTRAWPTVQGQDPSLKVSLKFHASCFFLHGSLQLEWGILAHCAMGEDTSAWLKAIVGCSFHGRSAQTVHWFSQPALYSEGRVEILHNSPLSGLKSAGGPLKTDWKPHSTCHVKFLFSQGAHSVPGILVRFRLSQGT